MNEEQTVEMSIVDDPDSGMPTLLIQFSGIGYFGFRRPQEIHELADAMHHMADHLEQEQAARRN